MSGNTTTSSDRAQHLIIAWSIFSFLAAITGNILLLIASLRHKVLRLDRVSVVLLENLSVSDIGVSLFVILPDIILKLRRLNNDQFEQNPIVYKVLSIPATVCIGITALLLPVLNLCKLLTLMFPFRARNYSYRDGYKIAAAIWTVKCAFVIGCVVWSNFYLEITLSFMIMNSAILGSLLLFLLATTLALLLTVHKARGLQTKGFFSIILVSVVFFVCYLPVWLLRLPVTSLQNIAIDKTWNDAIENIYLITCFSNPLLYYFTIQSFRDYVNKLFFRFPRSNNSTRRVGDERNQNTVV